MNKRITSIGIMITLIVVIASYLFIDSNSVEDKDTITKLPLPNEAEFTESFNQEINRANESHKKYLEYVKTPEGKKKSDRYWNKMLAIAKGRSKDIEFYGLLIDQNGDPAEGAIVDYSASSGYLTEGSGRGKVTTDKNGRFIIRDVVGTALVIYEIDSPAYKAKLEQMDFDNYPRFEDSVLWSKYTEDNPYVFKVWKVAKSGYPKTSYAKAVFGFKPGKVYSMDFSTSNKKKVKKKGALDLDMQVLFSRDDSNWSLSLVVPDGGLIESMDLYMNMAPESGYISTVNLTGVSDDRAIIKKYYIYSRGKLYGRLDFEIIPYYRKKSAIVTTYVMNLEGGRNLEVK